MDGQLLEMEEGRLSLLTFVGFLLSERTRRDTPEVSAGYCLSPEAMVTEKPGSLGWPCADLTEDCLCRHDCCLQDCDNPETSVRSTK